MILVAEFIVLAVKDGADCRLEVWAYKGEKFPWTSLVED